MKRRKAASPLMIQRMHMVCVALNILLNIGLNIHPLSSLEIGINAHYESKRYDVGGYEVPDVILNSFCILNAYAQYEYSKNIKFFIDTKNIANTKFFTIYGFNAIPFMFTGGVTIHL